MWYPKNKVSEHQISSVSWGSQDEWEKVSEIGHRIESCRKEGEAYKNKALKAQEALLSAYFIYFSSGRGFSIK